MSEEIFELWAVYRPFKEKEHTQRVAIFLSEESAGDYLHRSRLKKSTRDSAFRATSLLHGAQEAFIESPEPVPVEPRFICRRA